MSAPGNGDTKQLSVLSAPQKESKASWPENSQDNNLVLFSGSFQRPPGWRSNLEARPSCQRHCKQCSSFLLVQLGPAASPCSRQHTRGSHTTTRWKGWLVLYKTTPHALEWRQNHLSVWRNYKYQGVISPPTAPLRFMDLLWVELFQRVLLIQRWWSV